MQDIVVRPEYREHLLFIPDRNSGANSSAQTLSIVIPAYNEQATIMSILERIKQVHLINNMNKQVVIVNDASKDATDARVRQYMQENTDLNIKYCIHKVNRGKGAALHSGIRQATGDYIIIQDADLEYDPREYNNLLKPVVEGHADAVFGTRFFGGKPHRILFLLAFHRQQMADFLLQYVQWSQPDRYGDLLQVIQGRYPKKSAPERKTVWFRAGSHCKGRPGP
ncbi:glycosyltransferase family 2 protein [Puia sp. P3]|uniref:glycosyltransferase family 2 protein n=1 Tax=Puia sp. P3 TaxID=3423952 RepID=UPI003D67E317